MSHLMAKWYFFCQSSYLNSVTSFVDIFSCTNPHLSWHVCTKPYISSHFAFSALSCFYASVFAGARKLGLLEVCSVQPQLGHGYLLGNCLFIPHWISGSCSSVADPTFSLLSLIFPSLLLTDDNFLYFFSEV